MIAAVEAWRAGWFKREHWAPNIVAGLIVGVVALPLAMAFAIASGVKPEQGLYTSIIAGVAVALFGGSRIQIAGSSFSSLWPRSPLGSVMNLAEKPVISST